MIRTLNSTLANLVPTTPATPRVAFAEAPPPPVAQKLPSPKAKAKSRTSEQIGPEVKFPDLDAGVVNAALQAGVEPAALEEMLALMMKNPKGAKSLKQSRNVPHDHQCAVGERRRRCRRAWVSGWLIRSRGFSFDEAHEDCGAVVGRQEETCWCFSFGNCLRWSSRGTWWRIIILPWWQEVGYGEKDPPEHLARYPRGDSQSDREADGGGCAFTDPATGTFTSELHGSRMGGTQVEDRPLPSGSSCLMGHCWSSGSAEERKHLSSQGKVLLVAPTNGSELRGQRQLEPSQRAELGSSASLRVFITTPGPFSAPRWAEVALAHLKDQDDYIARRRNLGKKGAADQEEAPSPGPKKAAKYKAKAKAAPAADSQ